MVRKKTGFAKKMTFDEICFASHLLWGCLPDPLCARFFKSSRCRIISKKTSLIFGEAQPSPKTCFSSLQDRKTACS